MNKEQLPAIQTYALSRQFGSLKAVDNLSLKVESGTLFGFLGPNGAGKTTTIRLLLGLLTPSSGNGKVLGFNTQKESNQIRSQSGALLEHTGVYERLSALDNLEFYGRIYRIPTPQRRTRIKQLLTEMGLWERRDDQAGSWSRGMKQRLALARVLLPKPRLIFLDEPTAGLDVVSASKIRSKLKDLVQKEQTTIFLTTHNMTEVEQLCSQVAVIKSGRLITQGSPEELKSRKGGLHLLINGEGFSESILSQLSIRPEIQAIHPSSRGLTLDLNNENKVAPLVNWLVGEGVLIEEIRQDGNSLEEVFITLMEEEHVN